MIQQSPNLTFDNTEYAFAYKSNKDLKKAHFLFSTMGKPFLVKLGLKLMPIAIKFRIPFTRTIVKNTIFSQFVGGESLIETAPVAEKLRNYNVDVILDYGVEGGEGEANFNASTDEFIKVINYAASQMNIPFISIKVTGISRFSLLEKIDAGMKISNESTLMKKYVQTLESLSTSEKQEWERSINRLEKICITAHENKIGVLVDAEESWIQDPVDALTILMMERFNKLSCIIYNTIQLYRHDRLKFLMDSHKASIEKGFILGAKLVRGAYMEKERLRASSLGYPSPIQENKEATDEDYDKAIKFCTDNIVNIALIVASHNERSNLYTTELLQKNGIAGKHKHIHFSQLYGMSDNITFNLAKNGFSVSKYLPFGPINDVIPYLMRRAQENSSVAGQTGRELGLIKKELNRRGGGAS